MKQQIEIKTSIPGPRAHKKLQQLKQLNGGWAIPYPFIQSKEGQGCFVKDIDHNTFLDFASHVASNPLGYNHPAQREVMKQYANLAPVKIAGQDFPSEEHITMLNELTKITPPHMNTAFLTNSGAEAVENAMKISMKYQKTSLFGISFKGAFHGRTLGALSATNSKKVHKEYCLSIPMKRLPFNDEAGQELLNILEREAAAENVSFVIMEPIQGEGGYRVASQKMIKDIRKITKQNHIPFIADEVQSGVGRTGKWWAIENFGVTPDIIASAKALQIGATIANQKWFPKKPGAISTTWGGGALIDLSMGIAIIKTIKHERLMANAKHQGKYLRKQLYELAQQCTGITGIRGIGLMNAFDLPSPEQRNNLVLELFKNGVLSLGCGPKSVRLLPPLIIKEREIDMFMNALARSLKKVDKKFKHKGHICHFVKFPEHHA